METTIDLLESIEAEELFLFECENQDFFERMVPSRGEAYYHFDTFKIRHQELLSEQKKDTAEIGFRVGEEEGGKGVGNKALQQLFNTILPIHGKTTTANQGSQKVLERNGFKKVGIGKDEFDMNGQRMRFIHYL